MSLNVSNLRVYYQTLKGDVKALDGVTFDIRDGEIAGIVGESGCGKSTLSNSLITLRLPMKFVGGYVSLDGNELPLQDHKKMGGFRYKKISIIPQYAMNALNPTVKLRRLISDLLNYHGVGYDEILPELNRRLDVVNLDRAVLDMYPVELSGGMKQRAVMVISTLLNPSLLIADEITSALDVSTQRAVAEMIVEFRDKILVKSVIFVTHDISILYQIADSIIIMYAGKLVERAGTEIIINKPIHPYTEMLISSLPEVGVYHNDKRLKGIPGKPPQLLSPPPGCRFKERCPQAFEKCKEEPPMIEIEPNHWVACWRVK
ncbi:MAG TPA: ABC transporter ATP-binding protein [Mesotoga infera]|nr:ABC transporter ATP-binding protein [Mesotoga infera]